MTANQVKPCSYCGGREHTFIPNVMMELHKLTKVLGIVGGQKITPDGSVNLLICTACASQLPSLRRLV